MPGHRPLTAPMPVIGCWAFDVGCWMFRSPAKPLPEPPNATSPLALSKGYPLDLPAVRLPSCSTGKHRPLGNPCLSLTPNFSWVCGGRRADGTASAVSPSRGFARIHAGAGRRGHRKPLKRLGRNGRAPCTRLKLGANLMERKREISGLIPPNDQLTDGGPPAPPELLNDLGGPPFGRAPGLVRLLSRRKPTTL